MNELNQQGIFIGDYFVLNYYDILVFFQVTKTTKNSVFLIELATKHTKYGIMLTKRLKPSKNPLIIQKNNTSTKTQYEVYPTKLNDKEYWLPIYINYGDKIFELASKQTDFPAYGYAYACRINEVINKYWEEPKKMVEEEEEINWA